MEIVKHHYFLFRLRGSQVQSLRSHFLSHCIQTLDNTRSEQARSSCVTQRLRFQVQKWSHIWPNGLADCTLPSPQTHKRSICLFVPDSDTNCGCYIMLHKHHQHTLGPWVYGQARVLQMTRWQVALTAGPYYGRCPHTEPVYTQDVVTEMRDAWHVSMNIDHMQVGTQAQIINICTYIEKCVRVSL